jgi:hypothetical protein
MRRGTVVAGALLVAAGAGALTWYVTGDDQHNTVAAASSIATATVEQKDVVTYQETTATLGFTRSVTVSSPVEGTVTSVVGSGDTVAAGTVVATVDGTPVVAMIGDVPGFRDLDRSSSDGIDVRQLETNLVALGDDPDGAITIDETYDKATAAAVNRWKAALGLDEDGAVAQGLVTFVPGALQVDTVSTAVGSGVSSGGALLTARMTERQFPLVSAAKSTVTHVAAPGTAVATGTVLYRNDGIPVAAIEGDASAIPVLGRTLAVGDDAGADVKLLEQMVQRGGFDAGGTLVVDDTFDLATATAVLAWWQSIDPAISVDPADLIVPAGSFVVVPSGLQTGSAAHADGTPLTADATVMWLTSPSREVSTTAPIGDDTFALGATIDVEFPDGSISTGVVVDVGTVASNPSSTPGATPTVDIAIEVDEIPASVDSFVSVPVTLRVVDQKVAGAFVVPTSALVALREGGYALEVVVTPASAGAAAVTQLIAVEPGLYTDGDVVVTGAQVKAGLEVVVPS